MSAPFTLFTDTYYPSIPHPTPTHTNDTTVHCLHLCIGQEITHTGVVTPGLVTFGVEMNFSIFNISAHDPIVVMVSVFIT